MIEKQEYVLTSKSLLLAEVLLFLDSILLICSTESLNTQGWISGFHQDMLFPLKY